MISEMIKENGIEFLYIKDTELTEDIYEEIKNHPNIKFNNKFNKIIDLSSFNNINSGFFHISANCFLIP